MVHDDDTRSPPPQKLLPGDCCDGSEPCVQGQLDRYHAMLEDCLQHRPSPLYASSGIVPTGMQRLVLDTNVLLDLYVFRDPRWAGLQQALAGADCEAVTRGDCRDEYLRVLHYPQFALTTVQRVRAIEAHDAVHRFVATLPVGEALPHCTDPDDQKFLELAQQSCAHVLLSKDKALLKLARRTQRLGLFAILSPQDWLTANVPVRAGTQGRMLSAP